MIENSDLYDALIFELEVSNRNFDEFENFLRSSGATTLYGKCRKLRYERNQKTTSKVTRALSKYLREYLGRDLRSSVLRSNNSSQKLYYSITQDFTDPNSMIVADLTMMETSPGYKFTFGIVRDTLRKEPTDYLRFPSYEGTYYTHNGMYFFKGEASCDDGDNRAPMFITAQIGLRGSDRFLWGMQTGANDYDQDYYCRYVLLMKTDEFELDWIGRKEIDALNPLIHKWLKKDNSLCVLEPPEKALLHEFEKLSDHIDRTTPTSGT